MQLGADRNRPVPVIAIDPQSFATPGDVLPRPYANCYWLLPGRLLAGEHPARGDRARPLARLDALLACGVRHFVDLTEPAEPLPTYLETLATAAAVRALAVTQQRFPIADFGVPSRTTMRRILQALEATIATGEAVYLHCQGGAGRTGTAVGCLLVSQGFAAGAAFALIERKRRVIARPGRVPDSPETAAQREFVANWPPSGSDPQGPW
jgi:hypothetical protein